MIRPTFSIRVIAAAVMTLSLGACAISQVREEQTSIAHTADAMVEKSPAGRPTVQIHGDAWLMGEKIKASKPEPEIYDKSIVFNPSQALSLTDIANWIAENVGVRAEIDPSVVSTVNPSLSAQPAAAVRAAGPLPAQPISIGVQAPSTLSTPLVGNTVAQIASGMQTRQFFKYEGSLKGFLDVVDARFGVWSRYEDGTVTLFRTETQTYALPSLPDDWQTNGSISTGDTSSAAPSTGSTGTSSVSTTSSGTTSSGAGGQTISLGLHLNPWEQIQATAAAIAGPGASVVADRSLQELTISGTPPQCERVATWVKNLDGMFGKQIAIDVSLYQINVTQEENYGLSLSLAYKSGAGHTGVSVSGAPVPSITGTTTPMTLGASILNGSLSGSAATLQALSTLGQTSEVITKSGTTQNGKVLALQSATLRDYVSGAQSTLVASVGSTNSIQTNSVTPGFTASLTPKIVDGHILVDIDMTLSGPLTLTPYTSGTSSSQSSVQLRTLPITHFQQSVVLNPNQSYVVTGMRQQVAGTTNNGVGTATLPLLGGGVDAQKGDTIIAVVISAHLQ